ncbi:hypothetical protein ACWC2T_20840 [Streptomyces sp. NPDC001393]
MTGLAPVRLLLPAEAARWFFRPYVTADEPTLRRARGVRRSAVRERRAAG